MGGHKPGLRHGIPPIGGRRAAPLPHARYLGTSPRPWAPPLGPKGCGDRGSPPRPSSSRGTIHKRTPFSDFSIFDPFHTFFWHFLI
jgi:hypothetical protein